MSTPGPLSPAGRVDLLVDTDDPTPPYEQLRRQLSDLVARGALAPGQRVPPVRQLAGDLGLAAGTVARAYRELEAAGVLHSRRGAGTRVAAGPAPDASAERLRQLHALSASYWSRARALGFADEQIRQALEHDTSG